MRFVLLLSTLLALMVVVRGSQGSVDAFRLMQYSPSSSIPSSTPPPIFGSQKAALNHHATTFNSSSSVAGTVVVIPAHQITLNKLQEILANKPGGLWFLLPEKEDLNVEGWNEVQNFLMTQSTLALPIWFSTANENIISLYNQLDYESQSGTDQTTLVLESKEPAPLKKFELINIQGLLTGLVHDPQGQNSDSDVTKIPTIAITAYWDSFSAVPGMSEGVNAGASGVVGLFQVARVLSKLYSNTRTQARYNVVFLMSSGSRLNYAGTKHWIDASATGHAIRESIDFVICLDSLIGQPLYLHASRPSKDPNAARLYNTFTQVAQSMGIPFSVVQKKIDIADVNVGFEHEIFARRKVLAATVSTSSSSPSTSSSQFSRSNLFDTFKAVESNPQSIEHLQQNILFVTEAITRLLYQKKSVTSSIDVSDDSDESNASTTTADHTMNTPVVVTGSLVPNVSLSLGLLKTLAKSPRMIPFVDSKSPIIDYLENTLKQYASDVSRQVTGRPTSGEEIPVYFDVTHASIHSYRVKSISFDFTLLPIILSINAVLYTLLKGWSAAFDDLKSFLVFARNGFKAPKKETNKKKTQ